MPADANICANICGAIILSGVMTKNTEFNIISCGINNVTRYSLSFPVFTRSTSSLMLTGGGD